MARFPAVWGVVLLLSSSMAMPSLLTQPAKGKDEPVKQPTLAELLKIYQEWELPMPLKTAKLVRIRQESSMDQGSTLGWEISAPEIGKPGIVLRFLREIEIYTIRERFFPVPTPEAVLRQLKLERLCESFDSDDSNETELLLAIQCHHAGHDELARFFYSRCKNAKGISLEDSLFVIIWNYWTAELADPVKDRRPIAKVLKRLIDQKHFGDVALLRNLELTLSSSKAKPGSIESMIDALVDYKTVDKFATKGYNRFNDRKPEDRWDPSKFEAWRWNHSWSEPEVYLRLERLGLEAIAPLIEHVDDQRLTREWASPGLSGQPGPNHSHSYVKVGQLARRLLRVYFAAEFPGSKNDVDLNKKDYEELLEKIKGKNEYDYFIDLLGIDDDAEGSVARKIGYLYKEKVAEIYQLMLDKKLEQIYLWFMVDELIESSIPQNEKTALLVKGMAKMEPEDLLVLLPKLASLDLNQFTKECKALLAKSATEMDRGVLADFHAELGALVLGYDDPQWAPLVVELAKKMPEEQRFIFLTRKMNGMYCFVTKQNFYTVMGSFLDEKTVVDKGAGYLPGGWETIGKIEMRNAAAFCGLRGHRHGARS